MITENKDTFWANALNACHNHRDQKYRERMRNKIGAARARLVLPSAENKIVLKKQKKILHSY
jgi:hypothetical protein